MTKQPVYRTRNTAKFSNKWPEMIYIGHDGLPDEVDNVVKSIQRYMMDEYISKLSGPGAVLSMPKTVLCWKIPQDLIKTRLVLAGEDRTKYPVAYELIFPFALKELSSKAEVKGKARSSKKFKWSGNIISFSKVSKANEKLVVVKVGGRHQLTVADDDDSKRNDNSTQKGNKQHRQSKLNSVLVSRGDYELISSHKITISWLRSRLHKALNKYKDEEKNVEVIGTIKQKDGGPLFLCLDVEKKDDSGQIAKFNFLFTLVPAFKINSCNFVLPAFEQLRDLPDQVRTKFTPLTKQCLWKLATFCQTAEHDHSESDYNFVKKDVFGLNKDRIISTSSKNNRKRLKGNCRDKPRELTASQVEQCERCKNPSSRMLLEYFYMFGYIPEDEMQITELFVSETLEFIQHSLEEDRDENEPKVLDFFKCGSVPEKLKVVEPNEFDVMVKIELPQSIESYTFISDVSFPPGYVICQAKPTKRKIMKNCMKQSDEFGRCLVPEQLAFSWFYGKVVRAIEKYKANPSCKANLKLRRSGPAILLEIEPLPLVSLPESVEKLPRLISVDLVLALKMDKDDSRYAVAKRATEEQFYKQVMNEQQDLEKNYGNNSGLNAEEKNGSKTREVSLSNDDMQVDKQISKGRKHLQYLWRLSYSEQERRYLDYVEECQQDFGKGCQKICLMILKTICCREILKSEGSVVCHKLSSYKLKTALFHVLTETDLIHDWAMESLADRYVDLLDKLSKWIKLPHFFFNNAQNLRNVFPGDDWCKETVENDLMDELHATLKIQLLYRFSHIANSFKDLKKRLDESMQTSELANDYRKLLDDVLGTKSPEEVIHPSCNKDFKPSQEDLDKLKEELERDYRVQKAAQTERKSGQLTDANRNLKRPAEENVTARRSKVSVVQVKRRK